MKDLTKGKPSTLILAFALPIFFANLLQLTYSLVDTRIVGTFLGEDALAAVGATTTLSGDTSASAVIISIPPSSGISAINAQAKISTRLASLFGAIFYFPPISFAIGQVTMIAIVLFTIAAERIPDISPIPYSAPRLLLILLLIAPTSHSTPPYSRT